MSPTFEDTATSPAGAMGYMADPYYGTTSRDASNTRAARMLHL